MWPFRRKSTTSSPAPWFIQWLRGDDPVTSGVRVTPVTAERVSTIYACVKVASEDVAKLPLILYRRDGDDKQRAVEHPLYRLLHDKPNPWQTSFDFRRTMQRHIELRGNAYALKEKDARGRVVALWPLHPDRVAVKVNAETLAIFYEVRPPSWQPGGKTVLLPKRDVLHLLGASDDGIVGKSPLQAAREEVGIALSAQKHQASVFGNGARLSGVLTHPAKLTPEAADRVVRDWHAKYGGAENTGKVALLYEGMKFESVAMTNEDAQFLELRGATPSEICRFYRMPPHKVADLSKATFSNIEHQALEYVSDSLDPRLRNWEERLSMELLDDDEIKEGYFFEFLRNALVRGDIKSRFEAYNIGRQMGIYSANDIRRMENENLLPPKIGDVYLRPVNMVPADTPVADPTKPPGKEPSAEDDAPPDDPKKLNGSAHA